MLDLIRLKQPQQELCKHLQPSSVKTLQFLHADKDYNNNIHDDNIDAVVITIPQVFILWKTDKLTPCSEPIRQYGKYLNMKWNLTHIVREEFCTQTWVLHNNMYEQHFILPTMQIPVYRVIFFHINFKSHNAVLQQIFSFLFLLSRTKKSLV